MENKGEKIKSQADKDFQYKIEEAKSDKTKACDLYRSYVGDSETWDQRKERINRFRCGGF